MIRRTSLTVVVAPSTGHHQSGKLVLIVPAIHLLQLDQLGRSRSGSNRAPNADGINRDFCVAGSEVAVLQRNAAPVETT
jgi:hypothetical protein